MQKMIWKIVDYNTAYCWNNEYDAKKTNKSNYIFFVTRYLNIRINIIIIITIIVVIINNINIVYKIEIYSAIWMIYYKILYNEIK